MSEIFVRAVGIAILVGILSQILKALGWKGAPVFDCICIVGVVSLFGEVFSELAGQLSELASLGEISEYAKSAAKIISVGFLCGVLTDVFSEMGESGLAKTITLVCRLEIVCICLPYFRRIVDTGLSFLEYSV